MIKSVKLRAPAKLNLYLDIADKLPNGYHTMKMIMQAVNLYDYVETEKTDSGIIEIFSQDENVPKDKTNIVYKTAEAFYRNHGVFTGLRINIEKNIPMQAGMGGGSADSAAVLAGLNILEEASVNEDALIKIAAELGGDVPFAVKGGTCIAEGIGEKLTSITPLDNMVFLIIKPQAGISTKEAFHNFDVENVRQKDKFENMITAVKTGDFIGIIENMQNVFEKLCPLKEVEESRQLLIDAGAEAAMMTGSGSAVFGIFRNSADAEKAKAYLSGKVSEIYMAAPVNEGAVPIK